MATFKKLIPFLLTLGFFFFISCSSNEAKEEIETIEEEITKPVEDSPKKEEEETPKEEPVSKITPEIYNTDNFYTPPTETATTRVIFEGLTAADLNRLINQNTNTSDNQGVIIEIPKKDFTWTSTVNIKSNIHLEIAEGATISTTTRILFSIGADRNGARQKNISIGGKDGKRFTINISNPSTTNKHLGVVRVGRVDNYRIGDFNIKDRRTVLNSILMSHTRSNDQNSGSTKGVIENISQTGSHIGYGLVQTYSCSNVLFKNLSCEGGITLRMETDDRTMKTDIKDGLKTAGIRDIYAYNIENSKGLTALMFSPHFVQNENVTAQKIISNGSSFAVRSDKGSIEVFDQNNQFNVNLSSGATDEAGRTAFKNFISAQFSNLPASKSALSGNAYKRNNGTQWAVKLSQEALNGNRTQYIKNQIGDLKAGTYGTINVIDVTANYGTNAQIKQNHLKFIPCSQWSKIKNPLNSLGLGNGIEYHGPSVALSTGGNSNSTTGSFIVNISGQEFNGFPSGHTQNISDTNSSNCNNSPGSIRKYTANFPQ